MALFAFHCSLTEVNNKTPNHAQRGKAGESRYCSSIRVGGGLREESPVVICEKKTIEG